jgi:hypothetical protein
MNYIFYIVGFAIGLVLFIYALSFYETGKEKIKTRLSGSGNEKSSIDAVNPSEISYDDKNNVFPRERICPLCGAVLTKYEALYAYQQGNPPNSRILIYGCRYCYKPD